MEKTKNQSGSVEHLQKSADGQLKGKPTGATAPPLMGQRSNSLLLWSLFMLFKSPCFFVFLGGVYHNYRTVLTVQSRVDQRALVVFFPTHFVRRV